MALGFLLFGLGVWVLVWRLRTFGFWVWGLAFCFRALLGFFVCLRLWDWGLELLGFRAQGFGV